jgi:hypothetical protein
MLRLESSTTSVNAAWHYLLENKCSFSAPVQMLSSRALQKLKPLAPIETKVKILSRANAKKKAKRKQKLSCLKQRKNLKPRKKNL